MRWVDLYLSHLQSRHLAPPTVSRARYVLRQFFLSSQKDERDVLLKDIMDYREDLGRQRGPDGQSFSVENQNRHIRILAAYFRYLHRQGKILVNPCEDIPPLKTPRRVPRGVASDAEVMTLLRQPNLFNPIGFRDRAMMETLYSTGLRARELCNLMVYDVDLEARTVRVNQGKGCKDRIVPIGKIAANYVAEYLGKVRPILLARAGSWKVKSGRAPLGDCGALFLSKIGKAIRSSVIRIVISCHRQRAGLPGKLTAHSLRHACAIEMLRGGASIRHVQEMLGHSQIDTTQIYTRLVPLDLKKAHRRTSPSERRKKLEVPVFEKRAWRDEKNEARFR